MRFPFATQVALFSILTHRIEHFAFRLKCFWQGYKMLGRVIATGKPLTQTVATRMLVVAPSSIFLKNWQHLHDETRMLRKWYISHQSNPETSVNRSPKGCENETVMEDCYMYYLNLKKTQNKASIHCRCPGREPGVYRNSLKCWPTLPFLTN